MVSVGSVRGSHRWVGLAGVGFVVLFLASAFVGASELGGPDQPAETIARDFSENRLDGLRRSAALVGLSAVAGFVFVGSLSRKLAVRRPGSSWWEELEMDVIDRRRVR